MDFKELQQTVINGDANGCTSAVESALQEGIPADEILNKGLILAMTEVGERFENQEFFVPEMLIAAKAMQSGLDILRPHLAEAGIEPVAQIAIGTVQGDLHDIGKNLVSMMLEGAGFAVTDLGIDVPPDRYIKAINDGAQLIGMSSLLTTTMAQMPSVIAAIENAKVRDNVKIIVGGAPVTAEFAREIGADGFAPDASQAVIVAKRILGMQ
jgi:5-methyltetrahydrofolate--homocysteine methyltransferase